MERLNRAFQILPGLFVGNLRDSKDVKQLDIHRITHILSIHEEAKKIFKVSRTGNKIYVMRAHTTIETRE